MPIRCTGVVAAACTQGKRTQHGKPHCVIRDDQPDAREGQAGRSGVAERLVVPRKPGNSGGGKGPQFKTDAERSEGHGDWATSHGELWVKSVFIRACVKLRGLFRYPRSEPDWLPAEGNRGYPRSSRSRRREADQLHEYV